MSVSVISRLLADVTHTVSCLDSQSELHCWPAATRNDSTARRWWQQQPELQLFTHCWHLLLALPQQYLNSNCPYKHVLLCSLLALPTAALLFTMISWRLQRAVQARAKRLLTAATKARALPVKPIVRRPAPLPPTMAAESKPPKPPRPPKPPPRRHQMQSSGEHIVAHGRHKDAVATTLQRSREQAEQYKSLRRNLLRALDGLQQPLSTPAAAAADYAMPYQPPAEVPTAKLLRGKPKSAKLLRTLFKHISRPFGQIRRKLSPSSRGKLHLFSPIWQGLRFKQQPNALPCNKHRRSRSTGSSGSITSSDSFSRPSFYAY